MEMEQEEIMWKSIYDKLQQQKSIEEHTDHEKRYFNRLKCVFAVCV